MSDLRWPERPTCHDGNYQADRFGAASWRPEDPQGARVKSEGAGYPYGFPFKTCSYCGSISAEDLYRLMTDATPVRFDMADWKYGWPHKFYVKGIPNPKAGQPVTISWRSYTNDAGERITEPSTDPAPAETWAKFYTEHVADIADDDTRIAFTTELAKRTGVLFALAEDGRLQYRTGVLA